MASGPAEVAACTIPRWLQDLVVEAQLDSYLAEAAKWVESTGCTASDLQDDEEAVEDIAQQLGLRKYEVKRLRKALSSPAAGAISPSEDKQGDATTLRRSSSGDSPSNSCGSPDSGAALGSPGARSPGAPGLTATRRGSGGQNRRRIILQLPQVAEAGGVDGEGDDEGSGATAGRCEAAAGEREGASWDPVKITDGLTCKNTFFEISEDGEQHAGGPATCPPSTQGWWSSTASSPTSASPSLISLQEITATPSWSAHTTPNSGSRPSILSTQRKPWADATPDWFSTPALPAPSLGKVGSHFDRLLAEAAKEESDDLETDTTTSFRTLSASPQRRGFDFPTMVVPPPPPAPFQMFMMPPVQEPSPPPPRSAAGRVRLSLAQELGFQEARGGRRGGAAAERSTALRGRRVGGHKEVREPRRPAKKAATGSPGQPQPGVLVTDKPRPTRHRGSKEAKDPDIWPDDPFEGLPACAVIDLGSLGRCDPDTEMEVPSLVDLSAVEAEGCEER